MVPFLGLRPSFDRWTYWEKFDYWGEFWGIAVIGTTGFMLWFPLLVAQLFPGWVFNVATVIHSIEALLAAGVIFTVHFFNSHFRPGKFPMDDVIFTGKVAEHEFMVERPLEYERLKAEGRLDEVLTEAPDRWHLLVNRLVGLTALGIGVVLILCIIGAEIQQHFLK
jgi:cytochrome b subunit of formate dehydrogenase